MYIRETVLYVFACIMLPLMLLTLHPLLSVTRLSLIQNSHQRILSLLPTASPKLTCCHALLSSPYCHFSLLCVQESKSLTKYTLFLFPPTPQPHQNWKATFCYILLSPFWLSFLSSFPLIWLTMSCQSILSLLPLSLTRMQCQTVSSCTRTWWFRGRCMLTRSPWSSQDKWVSGWCCAGGGGGGGGWVCVIVWWVWWRVLGCSVVCVLCV